MEITNFNISGASTEEPHLVINRDRSITIPVRLQNIGVEKDHNIETVTFDCPRYWDGHDLSTMIVYINYMRADGFVGCCLAKDVIVDQQNTEIMHFTWTLTREVTLVKGAINFLICVKEVADGNIVHQWSSQLSNQLTIAQGLDCTEIIPSEHPDVISNILQQLETIPKPVVKTDLMVDPVGIDPEGRLYSSSSIIYTQELPKETSFDNNKIYGIEQDLSTDYYIRKRKISQGLKINNGIIESIGSCSDRHLFIPSFYVDSNGVNRPIYGMKYGAFNNNNYMINTVEIADGFTDLPGGAFRDCTNLQQVILPDSITSIGDLCFYGTERLQYIKLPKNITTLPKSFLELSSSYQSATINYLDIPEKVTRIERNCFHSRKIKAIRLPRNISYIGANAFQTYNSTLEALYIDNLKAFFEMTTENQLFSDRDLFDLYVCNKKITELYIPTGVTTIKEYRLSGLNTLTKIVVPETVNTLETGAFSDCINVKQIIFEGDITAIRGGALFINTPKLEVVDFSNCKSIPTVSGSQGPFNGLMRDVKVLIPNELYDSWVSNSSFKLWKDNYIGV